MLVFFIIYMMIIAALLIVDALIEWRAICDGKICSVVNWKRITQPIFTLLLLFSVVLVEKIISDTYNVVTDGFVANTAILIGLAAIIYVIDYTLGQFKLRHYDLVELKIKRENYIADNYGIMKFVGNRTYVKKNSTLNLTTGGASAADRIAAAEFMKIIANDADADEPPALIVSTDESVGAADGNSTEEAENLNEDACAANVAVLKKRYAIKKVLALILLGICLIFGIAIQVIGA